MATSSTTTKGNNGEQTETISNAIANVGTYNAIEPDKHEDQPNLMTKSKLWAVFFVQLNEAYQLAVLLPIVVFMCRDFGIAPVWLGVYSSVLNASFGLCQFLVSYLWGHLSDIFGRRRLLLIGLSGTFAAMTIFGFSTSFTGAVVTRCFAGFFNGNLGVLKAYLSDITDSSNRGFAFTIITMSFGMGFILGSFLGGILIITNDVDVPDEEYIRTTSVLPFTLFDRFPFAFPTSFCGGVISINALIWAYLFIADVPQCPASKSEIDVDADDVHSTLSANTIEMASNLSFHSLHAAEHAEGKRDQWAALAHPVMQHSLPTHAEFRDMLSKYEPDREKLLIPQQEQNNNGDDIRSVSDIWTRTLFPHALLNYGIAAMAHMMFKEMEPVFMAQALLFDSVFIGYTQAFSGVVLLVFAGCVQPHCLRAINHKRLTIYNIYICLICTLLLPSIYWFRLVERESLQYMTSANWLFAMVCLVEFVLSMSVCVMFVIAVCWVNNCVPRHCLGKANGIAQTAAAFVRGFGPLMTGFIWSESFKQIETYGRDYAVYYAFVPSAILYLVSIGDIVLYIPNWLQLTWEQREPHQQKDVCDT